MSRFLLLVVSSFGVLLYGCADPEAEPPSSVPSGSVVLRVATYNLEDVRTDDLKNPAHPRLQAAAAVIQRLQPDVILLNEVAYDQAGVPGFTAGDAPGQNGRRFVETFLSVPQAEGLTPLRYQAFTAPTNTGEASGFDLNNDGMVTTTYAEPPAATPDGKPGPQTDEGRAYGEDAWGFGTFPGQYGMVLLVREGLDLLTDSIRTFRELPWQRMPGALMPEDSVSGQPWYEGEEGERFRLSSKSHWDVPVRLPNGAVVHFLCSHPTPPAFDGPEQRNVRRNHDEIRLWADYLNGEAYLVDDAGRTGGLPEGALFFILGDQNADPDEGRAYQNPIGTFLLSHPRVQGEVVPLADASGRAAFPDLAPDATATWRLRVDYVLPSTGMQVLDSGIWRTDPTGSTPLNVSDHFPVWVEVSVPPA